MTIFKTYTGNAILNNALMTIEALGKLNSVQDITPTLLSKLYKENNLVQVNKRLKNYTMLFTKNGPLHNDNKNGDRVYNSLLKEILENYEENGDYTCEISGLKFQTQFQNLYKNALTKIGFSKKEIEKKDTSISRTWFPMIGGLGSDAQALPQAMKCVNIHPICIAILQFLPLSSLLYNRNLLLIDSSNFNFMKEFIADNQRILANKIDLTKSADKIDNVKFSRENYILKAISILEEKENYEEDYSDLNLWRFSNSGTGASCEIDRIPNKLIKKLIRMNISPTVGKELKDILNNHSFSSNFLNALEANEEWFGLYPNVFGSGKTKFEHTGYSVAFLEAYFNETNNQKKNEYAKYIANLVEKYKTPSIVKLLEKTSGWNESEFKTELNSVLITATQNGYWDLKHHFQIMDNLEQIPIKNHFYNLLRLIHFYYNHKVFKNSLPTYEKTKDKSNTERIIYWIIALIQADKRRDKTISELSDKQKYQSVDYTRLLLRASFLQELQIEEIVSVVYNENYRVAKYGINELLRIYFNQVKQEDIIFSSIKDISKTENSNFEEWYKNIFLFAKTYQACYYDKYENKETGEKPISKYKSQIENIPSDNYMFLSWFRDILQRINKYESKIINKKKEEWSEDLLHNPNGEFSLSFSKFILQFSMLKQISNQNKL